MAVLDLLFTEASFVCFCSMHQAIAIATLTTMPHFPITPDAEHGPGGGEEFQLTLSSEGHVFTQRNAHIKSGRKAATK